MTASSTGTWWRCSAPATRATARWWWRAWRARSPSSAWSARAAASACCRAIPTTRRSRCRRARTSRSKACTAAWCARREGMAMTSMAALAPLPSLDAMLSARTVWHAGRRPVAVVDGEPTGHAGLDALLPQGGWPRAALTELLLPADGVGELSLLLPTLARLTQAGGIVALVAPPYLPYAPAWQVAGVDLRCLEIIEADARGASWAFEQCLRSAACAAVLGWPLQADAQALRRLQVAAGSGDCLGFAFRDAKHAVNPSPAALRLEYACSHGGEGGWHIRKCRGANPPTRPFMPSVFSSVGAALAATTPTRTRVAAIAAPTTA